MATYAAMIDRMEQNIGRLLQKLEDTGKADNTVIFFLSDNGACNDSADRSTVKGTMPWEVTSYLTQGRPWANASNTPYRQYKTTDGSLDTEPVDEFSDYKKWYPTHEMESIAEEGCTEPWNVEEGSIESEPFEELLDRCDG